jgi:3-oxoacyl-[acyl-carrier protein] reductase
MDLGIEGRVAIVSGGSKGIGFATARALLAAGCAVTISARNPAALESAKARLEAEAQGRVAAISADMTERAQVKAVVEQTIARFGQVDIAVSNVVGHVISQAESGPHAGHFADLDPADFKAEFKQLLLSAWYLAEAVLPTMRARGWGRIVNVGSGVAREPAWHLPHMLPNAVRPAVAGLYRGLASRLASSGVTVNSVLTGSIATERNADYFTWLAKERGVDREDLLREMYAGSPIQRPGKPEEMAAVIAFLCSERARHISGQSLPVTGGVSRHLF